MKLNTKRILEFFKKNKWYIITFIVSTLIIYTIYTLQKIAPFGNNSMLDVDFYHQYGPFLNELHDRIIEGKSLLYSYNVGGGMPFYRNFLNYLSSPFNIFLFFFKSKDIVMSFSIIISLKVIFSSLFMSIYLGKTFKRKNAFTCVFSLLYSFSGYFCAYYWNIMWLDGMVFLPLVMLGINRLVLEDKRIFYTIILAIMLFANYFIGYMICIYSVLYFFVLLNFKIKFNAKVYFKKIVSFILFSLLAGLLVSFALLPLFNSLSSISATKDNFPVITVSFSPIDYLFNHLPGVTRTVFASDKLPLPNICFGYLTLLFIVSIFFNSGIDRKVKSLTFYTILFFFFCFIVTGLDFVWHAFHVPNDLPWRYSFLYVFSMITLAFYASTKIKFINIFKTSVCFALILIMLLLSYKLDFINFNSDKCIVGIILLLCYYVLYVFYYRDKKHISYFRIILIIFVFTESVYCINTNWSIDHDIKNFMSNKPIHQKLIKYARKDSSGFYRIEKTDNLTLNDGSWFSYNGMSTFTSMAYEDISKFQRMFGIAGNNINSYYYKKYQTPIYNTMFNIKYIIGDEIENDYYERIKSIDEFALMKYRYNTSIGYGVSKKINNWNLVNYDPFSNQSNFVFLSTGVNNIFEPIKVSMVEGGKIVDESFKLNSNGQFNYELDDSSNTLTLYLNNEKNQNIYLYVGGSNIEYYNINGTNYNINSDEYYISDIGKKYDGLVKVDINIKQDSKEGNIYFYAYAINNDKFNLYYNKLYNNRIVIDNFTDTCINGSISLDEDKTIFTTIAYDDGFRVYVDNKKVKTKKIANAYLGFDVLKGNHDIRIEYKPVYYKTGIVLSFTSAIILLIYYVYNKKNIKKRKKDEFIV